LISKEIVHAGTSLDGAGAGPSDFALLARGQGASSRSTGRDTVCGEDTDTGYAGNGRQVMAAFQEPRDQPAPPGRHLRDRPHPQAIGRDRTRMLSYLPL
jgi:hypothetical protein